MRELELRIPLAPDVLEAIAARAAELVLERTPQAVSPWMSPDEAAEFLRCRRQRIYELRSSGALTAYKEGDRAMVARAEVEALVVDERGLASRSGGRRVA